jgi:hypothetical protein
MRDVARLFPALFRFVSEEILRSRRVFFAGVLAAILVLQLVLIIGDSGQTVGGSGPILMIGLWVIAAPFCRAWGEDDVRLGYAAFWLQKPIKVWAFYLARLLAVVSCSVAATLAVFLSMVPIAVLTPIPLRELARMLVGLGWMPALLVVLSFLGSGLGARNGSLFAYAMLLAGLALPGFADSFDLGPLLGVFEIALPPALAGLDAIRAVRDTGIGAGVGRLLPLVAYAIACSALGLAMATRVPARLSRTE